MEARTKTMHPKKIILFISSASLIGFKNFSNLVSFLVKKSAKTPSWMN